MSSGSNDDKIRIIIMGSGGFFRKRMICVFKNKFDILKVDLHKERNTLRLDY